MLKAVQVLKILRCLNDPVIATVLEVITREDEWLVKRDKSTLVTKAEMEKATNLAKWKKKKEEACYKKVQKSTQSTDI